MARITERRIIVYIILFLGDSRAFRLKRRVTKITGVKKINRFGSFENLEHYDERYNAFARIVIRTACYTYIVREIAGTAKPFRFYHSALYVSTVCR